PFPHPQTVPRTGDTATWHPPDMLTSATQEFGYGLRAGSDLELLVNPPNVSVNSLVADAQFFGDFLVDQTMAQAVQNFPLPRREIFRGFVGRGRLLKGLHDLPRDMGRHR